MDVNLSLLRVSVQQVDRTVLLLEEFRQYIEKLEDMDEQTETDLHRMYALLQEIVSYELSMAELIAQDFKKQK